MFLIKHLVIAASTQFSLQDFVLSHSLIKAYMMDRPDWCTTMEGV